jgi:hypothetical protein
MDPLCYRLRNSNGTITPLSFAVFAASRGFWPVNLQNARLVIKEVTNGISGYRPFFRQSCGCEVYFEDPLLSRLTINDSRDRFSMNKPRMPR